MLKQIIELFAVAGKSRVAFNPAIKIKQTTNVNPIWIDDITKVNDVYIVTVANQKDNMRKQLTDLDDAALNSLHIRLFGMYGQKEVITHRNK